MSKTSFITNIAPLPPSITRDVALAYLHDHVEMITLNPLVIRHSSTTAPPNATLEEQINCKWYEITDKISYGITKSEVTYKGGFYDLENGLQTHVFAPAGVDLKSLWKVGGNMAHEPPEPPELGVNTPKSGLYLREDVELKCNVFLMSFVKRNLKKSHTKLVQDLVSKANDPKYAKIGSASVASKPGPTFARSQTATTAAGEHCTAHTPTPSVLSQQTSHNTRQDTPQRQEEPCACPAGGHEVMCPNYRYRAPSYPTNSSSQASVNPQSDVRSHTRRPMDSNTQPAVNRANKYAPASTVSGSNAASAPAPKQPEERQGPRQQYKPFRYDKPLPAGPPGSTSKAKYSSPQLFGEQAELPESSSMTERGLGRVGNEGDVVSELDGREIAYWRQQ